MAPDRHETRPSETRGHETRTVMSLRTGSKIAVLVALPFLGFALYSYLTPLWVPSANGVFGCGSAHNPPTSGWAKGACQGVPDAALYRAIISAVVGVLIGILGVVLFGVDRTQQTRPVRDLDGYDRYDDDRHDDDYDDERPAGPRSRRRRSYEEPATRSERRRSTAIDEDQDENEDVDGFDRR